MSQRGGLRGRPRASRPGPADGCGAGAAAAPGAATAGNQHGPPGIPGQADAAAGAPRVSSGLPARSLQKSHTHVPSSRLPPVTTGSMGHGCGSFRRTVPGSGDFPGSAPAAAPVPRARSRPGAAAAPEARGTHDARSARGLWHPAHARAWPGRHRPHRAAAPARHQAAPEATRGTRGTRGTVPAARPATPALTGPGHHRDRARAAPAQSRARHRHQPPPPRVLTPEEPHPWDIDPVRIRPTRGARAA